MTIITKFPGLIYQNEYGEKKIDFDIHPDFWNTVSDSLEDAGFKPGDEIVITISKTE